MVSAVVRILLIASLVAWSPAWCCCAIRAMAAGEAVCGDASAPGLSCCSRDVRQMERPAPVCCSAAEAKCCSDSDDGESPCRCADRVIEQQRLDTSVKVSAPRPSVDLLAAIAPLPGQWPSATPPLTNAIANLRRWLPPPHSLLAQSCLLRI